MRKLSIPLAIIVLAGCGDADPTSPSTEGMGPESGGSTATGGVSGSGGLATSGGTAGTGGFLPSGGMPGTGGLVQTGGTPATGGTLPTGGTGGFGPTGGVAGTGGWPSTGGLPSTGGVQATGGTPPTGGGWPTGGTPATGGVQATGGTPPTGGGWPTTGGTPGTGGNPPTGGVAGSGGADPTGGTPGSGGSAGGITYDCDLPPVGSGGKPRPSGSSANLKVLDWAGFSSAVSYSFDDANSSQISHYDQMNALGVRFTFYLQTGKPEAADSIWQTAYEDGHELGNHTQNHTCGGSDVDSAQSFIQQHFGVTAYTMAAPNGDDACRSSASKFLIIRSVNGGDIGPKDGTAADWIPSYIPGTMGTTGGKWKVYCIHGFTGGTDGAYQPIAFESFTSAVEQAVSSGAWVDSVVNVGSYWLAQKAFSGSGDTWTWDLPDHFPPNQCLRVTVDGGTLSQDNQAIAWDEHGYYEISLDAGPLTWTP